MRRRRPALSRCLAAVLALVAGWVARPAAAQCTETDPCSKAGLANWVGDLNNDLAVNAADATVFVECFLNNLGPGGVPIYCRFADFNFDGFIDTVDQDYLNQLVAMAGDAQINKLPRVTISELRVRKPSSQTDPAIPQSRYVEIRTPTVAFNDPGSPTVNDTAPGDPATIRRFGAGWFYVKVCRSVSASGTGIISGTVAVVQDLDGMPWVVDILNTNSRGLSLLADASFGNPLLADVPPGVAPFIFNAAGSLAVPGGIVNGRVFNAEANTNVTHLLVFRNPNPANLRAVPTVGQRVNLSQTQDPQSVCEIAFTVPASAEVLPPWDAVIDGVTIVRGLDADLYGCIYADTGNSSIGPVGTVGDTFAPQHVYRCRSANTLVKGPNAITATSDTPFFRNPLCTTNVADCGELNPDGTQRSCFSPQTGPYCSDADCCGAVCALLPQCCNVEWEQICADQAAVVCVTCGTSTASCFVEHPTPSCESFECCSQVCAILPQCCTVAWDAVCASTAIDLCLACGDKTAGPCDEVHDLPYCSDGTCCEAVCTVNPFCCTVTWDQSCVRTADEQCSGCGADTAGPCCIVHATPYCNDGQCCVAVCAIDAFCCESAWDLSCTQIAKITPDCASEGCVCGTPSVPDAPFGCFEVHELPGCETDLCCQTVCIRDPFCCYVTWDAACVEVALDLCATNQQCIDPVTTLPVNGSCFIAHLTPGCDKPGCCSQVCAVLPNCCLGPWDEACVAMAEQICDQCGDPLAGSCFTPHGTPNCANQTCCQLVCGIDPFCCEGAWDGLCAATAETTCDSPIAACGDSGRSCWIPNYLPGCSDGTCCTAICSRVDPFCCESRWDAVCAKEAGVLCTPTFPVTVGTEDCLAPHASAGCANADCTRAVCSVDPACCTTEWDTSCVLATAAVCPTTGACPSSGDCFGIHGNGGCRDSACCSAVCSADPTCCQAAWDAGCVGLANAICKVPAGSGWTCPCIGSCFEQHDNPGCEDGSCCAIVCNINAACCDASWDSECVTLARQFCCGAPGCGSGCNKDCLTPHDEPYCNDPYCCDAVCRVDPLCCGSSWDALCAAGATERCASACGLEPAGDCFVPHDLPGCRDGSCCGAVCAIDPLCCAVAWDDPCVTVASQQSGVCVKAVCGDFNAGPSCQPHRNPASDNLDCCALVCATDPYCCDIEWDVNCVDIAREFPACGCAFSCGDSCAGDCCRAHDNGSCDDAACCQLICAADPYCCDVVWDSVCASDARASCAGKSEACPVPSCGSDLLASCCVPSNVPNCSNSDCCRAVCALDPFCCSTAWDTACVQAATSLPLCKCTGAACGDPDAGSCFRVHATPNCDIAGCCELVCVDLPLCCESDWDQTCVDYAQFFCGGNFTEVIDTFGGKRPTERPRAAPPAGWIPARERAMMRAPKPLPPSIPVPQRPESAKQPLRGGEALEAPAPLPVPAPAKGGKPGKG